MASTALSAHVLRFRAAMCLHSNRLRTRLRASACWSATSLRGHITPHDVDEVANS